METTKLLFGQTGYAFSDMRREGGLGRPIGYSVAAGMIGAVASVLYQVMLQGFVMAAAGAGGNEVGMLAAGFAGLLVCMPLALILGLFISAGIFHLMLMMLGGANYSFETTFRTVAYAHGAANLLLLIPLCGNYVNGIVALIFTIIGLSKMHDISGGKATGAVLLPIGICCGLFFAIIMVGVAVG